MLVVLGEAVPLACAGEGGNGEPEQDPCDRGVDARRMHERPCEDSEGDQQPGRRAAVLADEDGEGSDHETGSCHREEVEGRGVEGGDDDDAEKVVDDGEREQERAQGGR